jgi:flagellar protein FliO/FliZ
MLDSLFGAETPLAAKALIVILILAILAGVVVWGMRRFNGDRLGAAAGRGRQPRLALIDSAEVDGRRRLVLIRRDNVEHLLMIGGPTDLVIEPNIVRAVAAPAPSRTPATADTLPRAVALGDAGTWPLQPEPAPMPRPQRAPVVEEAVEWPIEPELPPPPPPRRPSRQPVDPLAGIAAEVARLPEPPRPPMPADLGGPSGFLPREPARPREPMREREAQIEREPAREREATREREPVRERDLPMRDPPMRDLPMRDLPMRDLPMRDPPMREPMREREPVAREREPTMREPVREPMREPVVREREPAMREPVREPARMREAQPPPAAAEPEFNASADQNLADMAQRLEAALRRPTKAGEARSAEPRAMPADADAVPPVPPRAAPQPAEAAAARAEPKPAKSLYDSLEKEMANLLGRPSGKS